MYGHRTLPKRTCQPKAPFVAVTAANTHRSPSRRALPRNNTDAKLPPVSVSRPTAESTVHSRAGQGKGFTCAVPATSYVHVHSIH